MYQTPVTEPEKPSTEPAVNVFSKSLRDLLAAIGGDINESAYAEGHRTALLPESYRSAMYARLLESALYRIGSAVAQLPPEDAKLRTVHGLSSMLGYEEGLCR